jgi:ribosomal protein S18 acetylase RimI-like enzyme
MARGAHSACSVDAVARPLAEPQRGFILAEAGNAVLGFVEVLPTFMPSPAKGFTGAELMRLYVQLAAQRLGLGCALLTRAERSVRRPIVFKVTPLRIGRLRRG